MGEILFPLQYSGDYRSGRIYQGNESLKKTAESP